MPSCAIITCRARSRDVNLTNGGISFHRFPKDPTVKEQWIDATGRETWMPTKMSTICSKHFKEDDYVIKKSRNKYLKSGAVPQQNVVHIIKSSDIKPLVVTKGKRHRSQSTSDEAETIKQIKIQDNSPSSNTSTPRKRKLKEIIVAKDAVIEKQRKQIKMIQARNRRLKIKVNKIENIMNDMQQKFFMRNDWADRLKSWSGS